MADMSEQAPIGAPTPDNITKPDAVVEKWRTMQEIAGNLRSLYEATRASDVEGHVFQLICENIRFLFREDFEKYLNLDPVEKNSDTPILQVNLDTPEDKNYSGEVYQIKDDEVLWKFFDLRKGVEQSEKNKPRVATPGDMKEFLQLLIDPRVIEGVKRQLANPLKHREKRK